MTTIALALSPHDGWTAIFEGGPMPQGVPLPLPFTAAADAKTVRADLQRRFPTAFVTSHQNRAAIHQAASDLTFHAERVQRLQARLAERASK